MRVYPLKLKDRFYPWVAFETDATADAIGGRKVDMAISAVQT